METMLWLNLAVDEDDPLLAFTSDWIRGAAARVKTVHVITMREGRHTLPSNVHVHSMGKEVGASKPERVARFYRALHPILRTARPDACFAHMAPDFALLAAPLLLPRNIPIVTWYSHAKRRPRARMGLGISRSILTAAPEIARAYPRKAKLVPHGVDLTPFHLARLARPARPAATIVSVGRISPVKDCATLVRAAAILARAGDIPDLKIVFHGEAPERDARYAEEMRTLAQRAGAADVVEFAGALPPSRVPETLAAATVFVNMQAEGGKGKAVLEAMAAGLPPVLCTPSWDEDLGAWRDILRFAPGDAEALARQLRAVLALPEAERAGLEADLLAIAQRHSLDALLDTVFDALGGS